jgi:hypothetical protein
LKQSSDLPRRCVESLSQLLSRLSVLVSEEDLNDLLWLPDLRLPPDGTKWDAVSHNDVLDRVCLAIEIASYPCHMFTGLVTPNDLSLLLPRVLASPVNLRATWILRGDDAVPLQHSVDRGGPNTDRSADLDSILSGIPAGKDL